MKRLSIVIITAFVMLSVENSKAQIGLGAGLVYGTEIENFGIQVGATYLMDSNIRLAGDIIYFFPKTEETSDFETELNWLDVNVNLHYIFHEEDFLQAYGLAGLNYARLSFKSSSAPGAGPIGTSTSSDGEFGLNLGIGAMYYLNFAWFYGEAKYVISDFDQLSLAVGLRFPIGQRMYR